MSSLPSALRYHEQYRHKHTKHNLVSTGSELQSRPWAKEEEAPWILENGGVDTDLRDAYKADERLILAPSDTTSSPRMYSLPVSNNIQIHDIIKFVKEIYERESHALGINIGLGCSMNDIRNYRNRYLKSTLGFRSPLFHPLCIHSRKDIKSLQKLLERKDFIKNSDFSPI